MGIRSKMLQKTEVTLGYQNTQAELEVRKAHLKVTEPLTTSLSEIKKRNVTSYELVETDIAKIWRCLLRKNFSGTSPEQDHRRIVTAAVSDIDAEETVVVQCDSIPETGVLEGSLRIAIPFQRPGHWNLITIDVDDTSKIAMVKCLDTNGYAYPLDPEIHNIIKNIISTKRGLEKDQIRTIREPERHYAFSGQRGVNCGIVTACMMFDYLKIDVSEQDRERELRDNYADIIHSHMSDREIRNCISILIDDYGSTEEKKHFCSDRMTAFHGGGLHTEYTYNPKNQDEKEIYDCLRGLSEDSFVAVYNAIDAGEELSEQIASLRTLYRDNGIDIGSLFKNEDLELRHCWRDLIIFVANEKTAKTSKNSEKSIEMTYLERIKRGIKRLFKSAVFQYLLCLIVGFYFFGITGCICTTIALFTIKTYIVENQKEHTKIASSVDIGEKPVTSETLNQEILPTELNLIPEGDFFDKELDETPSPEIETVTKDPIDRKVRKALNQEIIKIAGQYNGSTKEKIKEIDTVPVKEVNDEQQNTSIIQVQLAQ
ncbi:MAG: hypothetical protein VX737_06050 [Pseudomonadota bacterium]|nr:hypothetical protein [Pseudomonadota bacterium]